VASFLASLAAPFAAPLTAQDPDPTRAAGRPTDPDRPRVGLVLGGGGARGFAHVGVLRALHDAHIPVDVVVGTSMGAIVGGLYAAGLPVRSIERLFEGRDWPAWFDDDPPRTQIPVRRKREERELLVGFELGIGPGGVRIPPGLFGGDRLLTLLEVQALHASGRDSFDDLPLPFRAVATDALTGEPAVLDRGSLALAMRASASVPGVFAPVVDGDRELLDGGLVDNLPVDVARALGADVIIAVDVGATLDEEALSALEIAERALTIMVRRASADQAATLGGTDWLIVPDLTGIGSSSFSTRSYERAFAAGLAAVRRGLSGRGPLAAEPEAYAEWEARRTSGWVEDARIRVGPVTADASRTSLAPDVVRGIFPYREGETLDREELASGVGEVLGYGGFATAGLELAPEGDRTRIELAPADKPWGPGILRTGLVLADRQRGRALWSMRALLTDARLNRRGGELRAEVQVGSTQRLRLEWYQPLDAAARWFADLRGDITKADEPVPLIEGTDVVDVGEIGAELSTGLRLGTWGEAAVGLRVARLDVKRPSGGGPELPDARGVTSGFARFESDLLDRPAFPSRGILTRWELQIARPTLGASDRFDRLWGDALVPLSAGSHTVVLGAEMGTALGDSIDVGRDFLLGGPFRLTAAERGTVRGSYAALARAIYYFRPGAPASRREGSPLRIGASLEVGQAWAHPDEIDAGDLLIGGSVFAAVDTPLGPVHAGWAWLEDYSPTWFFRLGPVF